MRTNTIWNSSKINLMQDIIDWMLKNTIVGNCTITIIEYPDHILDMRWGATIVF